MKMNAKRITGGEVMRKNLKKVVILLLCIMTLLSSSTADVFASTSGGRGTQTMVIQTKSNYWYPGSSSITLKQSKQTLTYQKLWGNKKKTQRGYYGYYNITVSNITKRKTNNLTWSGGQTKKIKLDGNCIYWITVSYNYAAARSFKRPPLGYYLKDMSAPSWWLSSISKVSGYR